MMAADVPLLSYNPVCHAALMHTRPMALTAGVAQLPDVDDPPKKRRNNVRTGCRTCKLRRVKCDETKPSCLKCSNFGRKCGGYEANVRSPRKELAPTKALIPAYDTRVVIPPVPRRESFKSEQEHSYFRVFCEKTCIALAGDLDKSLWNRIVLQACEDEPSLRHAVIALGALDKTLDANADATREEYGPGTIVAGDQHHTFALQHYGKSVKGMRDLIANGEFDIRKTLIGCLLAVCFECFHGNTQAAISQARSGLKLINECLPDVCARNSTLEVTDRGPAPIEDELIVAFNRLDINSVSFIYGGPVQMMDQTVPHSIHVLSRMPSQFPDFDSARQCMELLFRVSIHWVTFNFEEPTGEDEPVWDTSDDKPWMTTMMWTDYQRTVPDWDQFMRLFMRWWKSAQPLFAHARTPGGHRLLSTAIAIELRFRTCYIAFSNICGKKESYDESLLDPRELLDLAESLHARRKAQRAAAESAFVFDGPFIGALHVVTQKTRDPVVRRRAITLLESRPRREGLWDSSMVAKLATLSLKIEEEGSVDGFIPDHARIQGSRCVFDLQQKKGRLQFRKRKARPEVGYNNGIVEFAW